MAQEQAGYLVQMLDLPSSLINELKKAGLGETVQEVLTRAVQDNLGHLRRTLEEDLCLSTALQTGKRLPRKIDPAVWQQLGEVAEATGVPRPALLRACLKLLQRRTKRGRKRPKA
jgi:hypothetical protein